ncbi:hypothetical protein PHYSODRAFT_367487, partial [Phytophthora sojae]
VAVKRGHLDALDYLYKQGFACGIYDAMRHAIEGGQTSIVKWLLSNHSFEDDSMSTRIDNCAEYGHLEILKLCTKWFQANLELKCKADTMDTAATHGHLEVVKWLHANRSEGCTDRAMNWAARSGHLDVIQWLHYTCAEKCRSDTIYRAAEHGHLETVKWLYEHCS